MDRDRLTITMRKDILKKVDSLVDGSTIRNRSHAIETLITRAITPKVDTCIILAGGEGIKLRPLTYELPKSLIPIGGKPLVEYTVEMLKKAEIRNIVFAIGHLGEKIREYFGDGSKFGVKISYSEESKKLGTAGSLRNAAMGINGTFLAVHGDVLTEINISDLLQFHKEQETTATMALTTTDERESHGNVRVRGTKILEFIEKPTKGKEFSYHVNAGIYVFEPSILSYIPASGKSYLEENIFPKLAERQELSGFAFDAPWYDITTNESYEKALKNWKKK